MTIDASVTGTPGNLNFNKSRFTQKTLAEPLEGGWLKLEENLEQLALPVEFLVLFARDGVGFGYLTRLPCFLLLAPDRSDHVAGVDFLSLLPFCG